jgi:hypothetical protein
LPQTPPPSSIPSDTEEETDEEDYLLDDCWDNNVLVSRNTTYNGYFTRYGNGWTGSDATYSIPLDSQTNLWLFGDTFLGTVNPDRSRPVSAFIRNSVVLQVGDEFTTFHDGTESSPEAFLSPLESDWWYWPGHGQINNGQLQIVMFAFGATGEPGMFGFEYKAIDLITLSLPGLEEVSRQRKMLFQGTNYGATLLKDGGYTYIYGSHKGDSGFEKTLHIARIPGTDLTQEWEFYTGDGSWSTQVSESKSVFSSVSDQFSIIHRPKGYYLMTQNIFLGPQLYLYSGASPTGPFENELTIYCTPETGGDIITYNAFVHEQLSTEDNLFISYNNNSLNFQDLFDDADNYRPHFVNVKGWY